MRAAALKQGYRNLDGASAEFFVRCRHGQGYANSDIDRLNMQRYFYAGLFKRVRSMGITDVLNQLPLVFNNYIHTDMDLTTIAKMLVSFTRIDSANIMLAQTPVFMGVPNVGETDTFAGYSCVVPDAGSIAKLLNTYFRSYTGPVMRQRNEPRHQRLAPRQRIHRCQRPVRGPASIRSRTTPSSAAIQTSRRCYHRRSAGRLRKLKLTERKNLWIRSSTARRLPLRSQRSSTRRRLRMCGCSRWKA